MISVLMNRLVGMALKGRVIDYGEGATQQKKTAIFTLANVYRLFFDHLPYFSVQKSIFDENTIYLRLLGMKGFDAIQPEYNCLISMIISVDTLCGFAPLESHITFAACLLYRISIMLRMRNNSDRPSPNEA